MKVPEVALPRLGLGMAALGTLQLKIGSGGRLEVVRTQEQMKSQKLNLFTSEISRPPRIHQPWTGFHFWKRWQRHRKDAESSKFGPGYLVSKNGDAVD